MVSKELDARIRALSHEQAINVIIYFCGYEYGETMVTDALDIGDTRDLMQVSGGHRKGFGVQARKRFERGA